MADPVQELQTLQQRVKAIKGPIDSLVSRYQDIQASILPEIDGVADAAGGVAGTITGHLAAQLARIQKGADPAREEALLNYLAARAKSGVDSAAITMGTELKAFAQFADEHLADLQSLRAGAQGDADAYKTDLQDAVQNLHQACGAVFTKIEMPALAAMDTAVGAITTVLDDMPSELLSELQGLLPGATLKWFASCVPAPSASDFTPARLSAAADTLSYLATVFDTVASALSEELSLALNGYLQVGLGVVVGWAAGPAGKVGIDVGGLEGLSIPIVPVDMTAPFLRVFSLFFGICVQALHAAAGWMELDATAASA